MMHKNQIDLEISNLQTRKTSSVFIFGSNCLNIGFKMIILFDCKEW